MVPDGRMDDGRNGQTHTRMTPKLYPSDFVGGIIKIYSMTRGKIIRIYREGRIENPSRGSTFGITRLAEYDKW